MVTLYRARDLVKGKPKHLAENHMHTEWTDGRNSVRQMFEAACEQEMESVVFSEHSSSRSGPWFHQFSTQVQDLNDTHCKAYTGTEVRILDNFGNLDLLPEIKNQCQVIIASVHSLPKSKAPSVGSQLCFQDHLKNELQMMIGVLESNSSDILGHPFGMSLSKYREVVPERMWAELAEVAETSSTVLELNSKYHMDFSKILQIYARGDLQISVGSDAHSITEVGECWNLING